MQIAFTGDISFSDYFENKSSEKVAEGKVLDFLYDSEYVVANVEGPLTNCIVRGGELLNHQVSPESAKNLVFMHMNVWNLCNNHVDDCGIDGIRDTVAVAKENECIPLGIGNIDSLEFPIPIILEKDECRVGLLSISDNYFDFPFILTWENEDIVEQIIQNLKSKVDYIVVVFHEGREFSTMPTPKERKRYRKLLEFGVDVVVAHHPHVIQNYEKVENKFIFYSLGNFIFDTDYQRLFNYTDIGMLLKIHFSKEGVQWSYLPVKLDRANKVVRAIDLKETPAIFRNIQARDYRLLFPLAAKYLRRNEKKIRTFVREHKLTEQKGITSVKIVKKCYRKFRSCFSRYRIMLFLCSRVSGIYKLSCHRDLYQYIKNS